MYRSLNLEWHLFDPSKFNPEVQRLADVTENKVFIYNKPFEDTDIPRFASISKELLLISDIRTNNAKGNRIRSMPSDDEVRTASPMVNKRLILSFKLQSCQNIIYIRIIQCRMQIMENQKMQEEWVLQMNPRACCLKFRGAFYYKRTGLFQEFRYLDGDLHIQVNFIVDLVMFLVI